VGGGIDASRAALADPLPAAVPEGDLDGATVNEVELLLLVVEVERGGIPRRHDDHVGPETGQAELLAQLAKALALPDRVEVGGHRVALAAGDP
jgi:hypothetical protein